MPVAEGLPAVELPAGSQPAGQLKSRPSAREILASLGMAFLGFLLTAGVLHAAMQDPLYLHADMRSEKLYLLHQWRGNMFTAAFGTSHVHNGFDPRVFDATLLGTPAATHTANLAVEGGAQSEQYLMAREFLRNLEAPHQPQPCTVILELSAGAAFPPDKLVHPRSINLYSWPISHLMTHFVTPGMSPLQRLWRNGFAFTELGLHYTNVGMLSNEIFQPPLNQELIQSETEDDRRGQIVLPYHASYIPRAEQLLRNMPATPTVSDGSIVPGNTEMVQLLAQAAPRRNVSFVYLYMPAIEDKDKIRNFPDHLTVAGPHGPLTVPIVNLARSDLYPQIYNPQIWYDGDHVDGQGAQLVTRIFAQQLRSWYAAHGWPPAC
jgi:hypothetical protein